MMLHTTQNKTLDTFGSASKQQNSFSNSSLLASTDFKINQTPINSVRAAENPAELQLQNYLSIYLISN